MRKENLGPKIEKDFCGFFGGGRRASIKKKKEIEEKEKLNME